MRVGDALFQYRAGAHDLALISHATTLESRVPFLHFFDGFRTSHEVNKIEQLSDDDLRAMIDESWIEAHRQRSLDPDRPVLRGSAQNPDVFFQAREACNPFYNVLPRLGGRHGARRDLRRGEGSPPGDRRALKEVVGRPDPGEPPAQKKHERGWGGRGVDILRPRRPRSSSWSSSHTCRPSARWTSSGSREPLVYRWYDRYREGGVEALADYRSRPDSVLNGYRTMSAVRYSIWR